MDGTAAKEPVAASGAQDGVAGSCAVELLVLTVDRPSL
jgi:hypothetical protein